MLKNLGTHVVLDFRTHHMTVIRDKELAVAVRDHHCKQRSCNDFDLVHNLRLILVHERVGDIAYHQRDRERNGSRHRRKKHIRPENAAVWLIVRQHFFEIFTHFHTPYLLFQKTLLFYLLREKCQATRCTNCAILYIVTITI